MEQLVNNPAEAYQPVDNAPFSNTGSFESAQRMAKALASSTIVPTSYQNNVGNCLIAMEMANRMKSPVIAIMQNLHIIQGKPSWSSSFVIALLNQRFKLIDWKISGEGNDKACICIGYTKDGKVLEGPPVTMKMANAEGWVSKTGSKWKTMEDVMFRYRSAAFFGRLYAPDLLMGFHTQDEIQDIGTQTGGSQESSSSIDKINEKLKNKVKVVEEVIEAEIIPPAHPQTDLEAYLAAKG